MSSISRPSLRSLHPGLAPHGAIASRKYFAHTSPHLTIPRDRFVQRASGSSTSNDRTKQLKKLINRAIEDAQDGGYKPYIAIEIFSREDVDTVNEAIKAGGENAPTISMYTLSGKNVVDDDLANAHKVLRLPNLHRGGSGEISIIQHVVFSDLIQNRISDMQQPITFIQGAADGSRWIGSQTHPAKEKFPNLSLEKVRQIVKVVDMSIYNRVLEIAINLARKGNEGKKFGMGFVLGGPDSLQKHLKPSIMNPWVGQNKEVRSIHNPNADKILASLSGFDGITVVATESFSGYNPDASNRWDAGLIYSTGEFIDVPADGIQNEHALGLRNFNCRAITRVASCIAIVIGSDSNVRVYLDGQMALSFDESSS